MSTETIDLHNRVIYLKMRKNEIERELSRIENELIYLGEEDAG